MKRLFLLFNLFLSVLSLNAQEPESDYRPFIEEGKVWVSKCDFVLLEQYGLKLWRPGNQAVSYFLEYNYFEGDTIVGGRECKKWTFHYYSPENDKSVIIYLPAYEEDKKVWFYFDVEKEPLLAYDFGAKVGDSIVVCSPYALFYDANVGTICNHEEFVAEFQDTLVIHSRAKEIIGGREQLTIRYTSAKFDKPRYIDTALASNCIMEGIGTQWPPEFNQGYQRLNTLMPYLFYCFLGDEMLYDAKDKCEYFEISYSKLLAYYNVLRYSFTGIRDIPAPMVNSKSSDGTWYDLSGRRLSVPSASSVSSVLPPGVYIKDGKKIMVK